MKAELDAKLVQDFPMLYIDRHADLRKTCMCFGFECGDGWYGLINDVSAKLEKMIVQYRQKHPNDEYFPHASQVKEKFGTLRFYMSSSTDEMNDAIREAEDKSSITCERCGNKGKLCGKGWLTTLCASCEPNG